MRKLRSRLQFGLQGALLTAFISLSIVTVSLVAAVSILFGVRTSQNLVLEQLVSDVDLNEQAIDNWLDERVYNLHVILRNPADGAALRDWLRAPDGTPAPEALLERLQIETRADGRFAEVFVIGAEGRVVLSTDDRNVGQNHRHQSHFQEGRQRPFVSGTFFNVTAAEHQVIVALPVLDVEGQSLGVLTGRLRVADLTRFVLSQADTTETGQVYLVSQERQFITALRFAPQSALARSEAIDQGLDPDGLTRRGEGAYLNYNGERVLGAYRWLPGLRVVLISERHQSEAFAGVWPLVWLIVAAAGFAIALAVGLGLLSTRRIIRPVQILTETATAVAEGDLSRSVDIPAQNEIGILAQAFGTMTERLRGMIAQLENRVQERTQVLEQRTAYLEASAEVGHMATSTLDVDVLMQQVVDLIQERLDVYYVGLFLIDPAREWIVLQAGTGDVGRQLRARDLRVPIDEGSLIGSCVIHRRAYVIQDVTQDKLRMALPELPDTRSEVALPLQVRGEVIGALTVEDTRVGTFDTAMVNVLQSMVDQVAVALQNARLFSELQVALEAERRAYGDVVGEAWAERIGGRGALHYAREADGQVKALLDVAPAPNLLAARRQGARVADEQQANVAIPIKVRERAVGAIQFRKSDAAQAWSADELDLLETLTEQLGVALESARLYEDTQRRAAREQLTGEVASRMRESLDMDAILQTAIREMGERLGIAEVEVRMGLEE